MRGPVVFTFEAAGEPFQSPDIYRHGWCSVLFRRWGVSHVSVKPKVVDWYRKPDLLAALLDLRSNGFLALFDRVITYGGSMGGYAAIAYADILQADTVLAINPQTTLSPDLVPWENRFSIGLNEDWSTTESDAAANCLAVRSLYVVVDRRFHMDWGHVVRLSGHNLKVLNLPFLRHHLPAHMVGMKVLMPLLQSVLQGDADVSEFHRGAKRRRDLAVYYDNLAAHPRVQQSAAFSGVVESFKAQSQLIGS